MIAAQIKNLNSNFSELFKKNSTSEKAPAWLSDLQNQSMAEFSAKGFPTRKNEEWRYTNVKSLGEIAFTLPDISVEINKTDVNNILDDKVHAFLNTFKNCIVFVNGSFAKNLSNLENIEKGLRVSSLADEITKENSELKNYFLSSNNQDAFENLNTAFSGSGVVVSVDENIEIKETLHIIYLAAEDRENLLVSPRTFIFLKRFSKLQVVESYISFTNNVYFTNAVTEVHVAEGAALNRVKLQAESPQAFHVSNTHIKQEKNSRVTDFSFSIGAQLCRNNLTTILSGEGAAVTLDGLYAVKNKQHVDHHTSIEHAVAHTTSQQLYKGILDNESRAIFNGKVIVNKNAQKIASTQLNKNLLLSSKAEIDTKPQLEIAANDIKCTHGATVGQISEAEIFYFQSRGIPKQQATELLMQAFADDVLEKNNEIKIRDVLKKMLRERYFYF